MHTIKTVMLTHIKIIFTNFDRAFYNIDFQNKSFYLKTNGYLVVILKVFLIFNTLFT